MARHDTESGVKVPPELHDVPHRTLEEYVRSRLLQFAPVLASRICNNIGPQLLQQATFDALQALPPADYTGATLESRDLQLVYRHDCQSLGCLDAQCVLCEHNPHRRCSINFCPKYLVNDALLAKCEAPIRVEVMDRATGLSLSEDIPGVTVELCVLDGHQFDQRCSDAAGGERVEDVEACALLLNNKAAALLVPGPGGSCSADHKVLAPLIKGVAHLPEVHVSDSSEALLSGRKPPFRLFAKAVSTTPGVRVPIRHAVSEGFVVATRRTRTAGKVDIPNVDDHVGKLEHMGKETVKKLQDIRSSGLACNVDVQVPDNCINKVGEFRKLAMLAEGDGHLRQKLQQVLKLSKEKWEEARDHAMRAVVADSRMRIWYADKTNMDVGLLFTCRLGAIDLDRPVGLLTKTSQDGVQTTMEATLMAQQTPAQREQVRALQPQASAAWWHQGHPGWAIYPVESEQFMSTGTLDPAVLPSHDHVGTALTGAAVSGGPAAAAAALPFNSSLTSAFLSGSMGTHFSNEALLRALGGTAFATPFLPADMAPAPAALGGDDAASPIGTTPFATAALPVHQQQQQGQNGAGAAGASLNNPSPFGRLGLAASLENMPSLNLGNLQAMLGPDFRLPSIMAGFPSIPGAGLPGSGDLEHLLLQHGSDFTLAGGRLPSFALGKFGSLEPAGDARVQGTGSTPRGPSVKAERNNSGLESMQSIEHALADTQRTGSAGCAHAMHAAMDAAVREVAPQQQLAGSKRK